MKALISKLLTETITKDELILLHDWLEDPKNQLTLEKYVSDYHDLNLAMIKSNVDAAYEKVIHQIENKEKPVKYLSHWVKYAAAIVILFGIGFFYQQGFFNRQPDPILVPKDNTITLELGNGKIETIDLTKTKEVRNANGVIVGSQNQDQLRYQSEISNENLVYHTLRVPFGKRIQILLSDGTRVDLNAGTTLRYPVNFLKEGSRQVFLEGEAFFDVSEDKEHPFMVNANSLNVEVLGTRFNISSYGEDLTTNVVLVEGSVRMSSSAIDEGTDNYTQLSPGEKGTFDPASKNISLTAVNTDFYTSWVNGNLVFRNMSFKNIAKKLERHYNLKIEIRNEKLKNEFFSANFKEEPIEKVLSYFRDSYDIEYTVEDGTVLIE